MKKKIDITRRDFVKVGLAASVLAGCGDEKTENIFLPSSQELGFPGGFLTGNVLTDNAGDYKGPDGNDRKAVPSACWQCVVRDGIIGYVNNGRLEHIRGNPRLLRTNGKLCARGQGGVGQVYDPDRLLFPMKQTGARGEAGGWKRVSWDEALDEVVGRIGPLRDAGTPERFMFHYGRMKASSSKMVKSYFLPAYGTATIGDHTSICEGAKWVAQELTWGKHYDINDVESTNFMLNFGCNLLEAHTNHIPLAQRVVDAMANGVEMYTFDVRLSNTAARSTQWVPVRPATDLAVLLAMANYIMNDLGDSYLDTEFIDTWTGTTVTELKNHLSGKGYTPEWAAGVSGVPAGTIRSIAKKYAENSYAKAGNGKGATVITYRGAVAHYNGVMCERAAMMLSAICGNTDRPGGRTHGVGAAWKNTYSVTKNPDEDKLHILDGEGIAYPDHHVSHKVLEMIENHPDERPAVYMTYCYNAAYSNGNCAQNVRILKDRGLIPYFVAVDVCFGEGTALADLILPDATYLERWDWEDMASMNGIHEYYIRQPVVDPLGEARDFKNVCVDLAARMGFLDNLGGWTSAEEFVKDACDKLYSDNASFRAAVQQAGYSDGFTFMKHEGAWYDPSETYSHEGYKEEVTDTSGAILDVPTQVWWTGNPGEDYTTTSGAYKKYVGQQVGDKVYKGFPPDKVNKSGRFEIKSGLLPLKGFPALPEWMPVPEFEEMGGSDLVLTTFKVAMQTHSRTQNCKYLTEIYHENPAWINPATASGLGISDGDAIRITNAGIGGQGTEQPFIITKARVTEQVVAGVVAVSHHCGHWQYGRYATAGQQTNPLAGASEATENNELLKNDPDAGLIWWDRGNHAPADRPWSGPSDNGVHPNWIIPNSPDPIGGELRWMDTVVTVERA